MIILTTGYGGDRIRDKKLTKMGALVELIEREKLILVDIRYRPNSIAPCWRRASLERLFDAERYLWLPELGNVNYNTVEEIQISDMATGRKKLLAIAQKTGRTPLLLCVCDDADHCHRTVVAEDLRSRPDVEHIVEVEHWDTFRLNAINADLSILEGGKF